MAAFSLATWSHKVRFVGAGAIGVSAIWTLGKLVRPVAAGLRSAMVASRARKAGQAALLPRTEQDIPIGIVGLASALCILPAGVLLAHFDHSPVPCPSTWCGWWSAASSTSPS